MVRSHTTGCQVITVYSDHFDRLEMRAQENRLFNLILKDDLPGFEIAGTLRAQSGKRGSGSIFNKDIVKDHCVNLDRVQSALFVEGEATELHNLIL